MKNIYKIALMCPLFIIGAFGMNQEKYTLEYQSGDLFRQTYVFSDEDINISALIHGTDDQKLEITNDIFEKHSDIDFSRKIPTIEDIIFYMMSINSDFETYIMRDENDDPKATLYRLKDSNGDDLTLSILGTISRAFIEQKLLEIESFLSQYPIASNQIAKFKQVLVMDYIPGTEMSTNYLINEVLKDSSYKSIEEYNQAVMSELTETNYHYVSSALELIAILHNMK